MSKTIMRVDLGECMVCGTRYNVHVHHIVFGNPGRKLSDKFGLTVGLCQWHHEGNEGPHHNREFDLQLKRMAEERFEEVYHRSFREVFGKSYAA